MQIFSIRNVLIVAISCSLFACNRNSSDSSNNVVANDLSRPIDKPRFLFSSESQPIEMSQLDSEEKKKIMNCEEPSSQQLLKREKYKVEYTSIYRFKIEGFEVMSNLTNKYSTENSEEIYNRFFGHTQEFINGVSVLIHGPYSLSETCTKEGDCDKTTQKYLSGNASIRLKTKLNRESILQKINDENKLYSCFIGLDDDKDFTDKILFGSVEFGGKNRPAVERVRNYRGKIYCNSTHANAGLRNNRYDSSVTKYSFGQKIYMGQGEFEKKSIILTDDLAGPISSFDEDEEEFDFFNDFQGDFQCIRSVIFRSETYSVDGNTIRTESREMADYNIDAEFSTAEELIEKKEKSEKKLEDLKLAFRNFEQQAKDKDEELYDNRSEIIIVRRTISEEEAALQSYQSGSSSREYNRGSMILRLKNDLEKSKKQLIELEKRSTSIRNEKENLNLKARKAFNEYRKFSSEHFENDIPEEQD